ncbi:hypothetical protein BH10ACI3_BH10ACI3_16390 [soil metagenome]
MKHPILGMIAVFCLQAGFIAYTALDHLNETMATLNDVTIATKSASDIADLSEVDEYLGRDTNQIPSEIKSERLMVSKPDEQKRKNQAGFLLTSNKRSARIPAPVQLNLSTQFNAMREPRETRVRTEYPRSSPTGDASKNHTVSTVTIPKPEKRSIVSKTVAVIKKPFDWLKTVASRLR